VRVLLVSAGDAAAEVELAEGLAAQGWSVDVMPGGPIRPRSIRRATDGLTDSMHEREVSLRIRAFAPRVVHCLGFGGVISVNLPWLVDRLGAAAVVDVQLERLVCHRGDLRFRGAEACATWDDPARCAACCNAAAPSGLSRPAAALAAACAWLGDLSPFAKPLAFRNRFDLVRGGIAPAAAVLVEDERAALAVRGFGVPSARIEVLPRPRTAAALAGVYERAAR
jgi:hypothetical protein